MFEIKLNVMIVGGEIHSFEHCSFKTSDGWLIVRDEHSQEIAVYAEHRTVRAWYDGIGPVVTKA